MFRALWFVVKLVLIVALVVWVAERPGNVRLDWVDLQGNEFVINVQIGLFLAALIGVCLLSIMIYSVIKGFADFPKSFSNYKEIKAREKGYTALTKGLAAVAAGDTKAANKQAEKARKFLPDDTGLPLLLDAQAARLDGRESDAAESFVALLEDKNASFLGVRGLLQSALDAQDYETAYTLASKALSSYPKQEWVLKIAFDLQVRLGKWDEARKSLKALQSVNVDARAAFDDDRAALWLAEGKQARAGGHDVRAEEFYKKAQKASTGFAPSVLLMAQLLVDTDRRKKAVRLIEKQWTAYPHDAYVHLWDVLMDEEVRGDPLKRLRWFEKLLKHNAEQPMGLLYVGQAALDAGLWGEAREYFAKAEDIEPSAALFKALAELEERSGQSENASSHWLNQAVSAPSEKSWVCRETGQIFETWQPIVQPGFHLNSLEWREPTASGVVMLGSSSGINESLLEAPSSDAA